MTPLRDKTDTVTEERRMCPASAADSSKRESFPLERTPARFCNQIRIAVAFVCVGVDSCFVGKMVNVTIQQGILMKIDIKLSVKRINKCTRAFEYFKRFQNGPEGVEDASCLSHPSKSKTDN